MNHKYFTIEELIYSENALKKYDIRNKTTQSVENNLDYLITHLLDPIREKWGKPIQITSGYRCKELNDKIGGSSTSQHVLGLAADLDAGTNDDNRKLAQMIASMGISFDQLIDEKGYQWVHIGTRTPGQKNRQEILRYNGKSYIKIAVNQL